VPATTGGAFAEILFAEGQSEIGDHGLVGGVDQDIGGLNIAVDQSALMRMMQGLGDAHDQRDGSRHVRSVLGDAAGQIAPRYEFRHDVEEAIFGSIGIVNRHDSWVIEAGKDARLGQVGFHVGEGGDPFAVRHLDGDLALHDIVIAFVDDAEAAGAEYVRDPVAAEARRRAVRGNQRKLQSAGRRIAGGTRPALTGLFGQGWPTRAQAREFRLLHRLARVVRAGGPHRRGRLIER
jgi:hypothetical protein